MSKHILVINGSISKVKISIVVQYKDPHTQIWENTNRLLELNEPGQFLVELVHSNRRIIIEESKMTKHIHMINGDTSNWKVKILVQDRLFNLETGKVEDNWTTTETLRLDYPGQLQTKYLTSTRRLVIEEDGA